MTILRPIIMTSAKILACGLLCLVSSQISAAMTQTATPDSLNRLTTVDYGNGLVISYTLDGNGNRLTRTVQSNYRLITVEIPSGGGTVTGAGIVTVGQIVTLQASPDTHRRFGQWKEGSAILGSDRLLSFTVTGSRTLQASFVQLDPFDSFVTDFGLDPTGSGAPEANPTGDGVPNLLKFALGGNPTIPGSAILPSQRLDALNGVSVFVFDFYYSLSAAQSVTLEVDYSTDLVNWATAVSGQDGVTVVTAPVDATKGHTTVTIPKITNKVFARLRVTQPPPVAP